MGRPDVGELDIVRAGVPEEDGCPILTRLKSFVVSEGQQCTLEHQFRDRQGRVLDLGAPTASDSASSSGSDSGEPVASSGDVLLRIKEFSGRRSDSRSGLHCVEGTVHDANDGAVRAELPKAVIDHAGLYWLSWGYSRGGKLLAVNDGLLSVERSLFGLHTKPGDTTLGPPTIQEIRMQMMDSSGAENLLLDEVEFGDDEIALAIQKPVQYFNEVPPPLGFEYTTKDFPFRSHWLDAVAGYLHQFAANHYRRNRLATQSGGITVDDKNKEQSYLQASRLYLEQWYEFVRAKKIELNARQFVGVTGSPYGSYYR